MERKLYAVQIWMECEVACQALDSIWDSREAAHERLLKVMRESNYTDELEGSITPIKINTPLFGVNDYETFIRGDELG